MKVCRKCCSAKAPEEFGSCRSNPDGLDALCRLCRRAYAKDYRSRNREKVRLWFRTRRQADIVRRRAMEQAKRERTREQTRAYQREYMKRRYHANLEESRRKVREAAARRRRADPVAVRQRSRATAIKLMQRDPEGYRLTRRRQTAERRARVRKVTTERVDFDKIAARDGMRCHICRRRVAKKNLHFDHVIPIAAGGTHTENNIAVAHSWCNVRKNRTVLSLF